MVTALLNSRLKINGLLAGILVSIALWTVNLRVMQDKANLPLLTVDTILTPVRQYIADPNLRGVFVFGVVVLLVLLLYWLLPHRPRSGAAGDRVRTRRWCARRASTPTRCA